jgi:hypothetical protein
MPIQIFRNRFLSSAIVPAKLPKFSRLTSIAPALESELLRLSPMKSVISTR